MSWYSTRDASRWSSFSRTICANIICVSLRRCLLLARQNPPKPLTAISLKCVHRANRDTHGMRTHRKLKGVEGV